MTRATMYAAIAAAALSAGTAPGMAAETQTGKELFTRRCGVCHLEGGTGTFMLGRRLGTEHALLERRDNLSPELVTYVARNGLMSMPRFTRAELSDSELKLIAEYLSKANR